ncbi:MFS transporter [Dyadobacter sp. CY261]|uniref:MFS transporter n=1 Tax=Dyadobacter sp. CY261 TaxID=2907203 RepID=UPI001F17679B|nr:MFS transporter [Dyadobacter sp. CY261]MCF0075355.1 MFS transporter [Dyadobacter sp. CY261]
MIGTTKFHYSYVIVICCCLIMGVDIGLVMSCAGIFYKPVSSDLGVSVGDFGLYMTFIYALSFLMLSLAGRMMDKFSARWLLTISSGILGLVYIGMSTFSAVWQFYAAGTLIGVALAFLLYLSYPVLINRWFKVRVGFFIGLCSAASGVGGVLFNPLAGRLIAEFGWRNTYLIFGIVILLIVTPVLALLLRNHPKDMGLAPFGSDQQQNDGLRTGIAFGEAIKNPVFYLLLVFAFFMISVSTLNLFLPTYITNSGFSVEQSALVASSVMLGVTVGKVALGLINDKSSLIGVLASTGLGVLGFVFLLTGQDNIAFMLIGAFLFGWAYAGVTVETALLVRSVFGSKDYARIFAIISIALAAGGAVMAGGWGYLADFIDFKIILMTGIGCLVISGAIGCYALKKSMRRTI